jgi:hypothetical protein
MNSIKQSFRQVTDFNPNDEDSSDSEEAAD